PENGLLGIEVLGRDRGGLRELGDLGHVGIQEVWNGPSNRGKARREPIVVTDRKPTLCRSSERMFAALSPASRTSSPESTNSRAARTLCYERDLWPLVHKRWIRLWNDRCCFGAVRRLGGPLVRVCSDRAVERVLRHLRRGLLDRRVACGGLGLARGRLGSLWLDSFGGLELLHGGLQHVDATLVGRNLLRCGLLGRPHRPALRLRR